MVTAFRRFCADASGAAMVEMTIVLPVLLVLLLGFVDFGYAFYEWNAADKAVQVGARLARVSDPVASGLMSEAGTPSVTTDVGAAVPAGTYDYLCSEDGTTGTVTCTCQLGTCQDLTADKAAFNLIFCGDRVNDPQHPQSCAGPVTSCDFTFKNPGRPGMCDIFPNLKAGEVQVEYAATGLGYWTRPGPSSTLTGPVPTISLSIVNHHFQFFFLGGLLRLANSTITMPSMLSTVTGEDLHSSAPS